MVERAVRAETKMSSRDREKMRNLSLPVPNWARGVTAINSPERGEENWVGAANAIVHDGFIYLVYRERYKSGRGNATIISKSPVDDGVNFTRVSTIQKDTVGAESLERPALDVTKDGKWRLYLSRATPGTKHWDIVMLEADDPSQFGKLKIDPKTLPSVIPHDDMLEAVKDPVLVKLKNDKRLMWVTVHPLTQGNENADQMKTALYKSDDGKAWTRFGIVMAPKPGQPELWDSRGTRVTSVFLDSQDTPVACSYDGRHDAAENYEEKQGFGYINPQTNQITPFGDEPFSLSPFGSYEKGQGLRYMTYVDLPDNQERRIYYEARTSDGSHEIRTELITQSSLAAAA